MDGRRSWLQRIVSAEQRLLALLLLLSIVIIGVLLFRLQRMGSQDPPAQVTRLGDEQTSESGVPENPQPDAEATSEPAASANVESSEQSEPTPAATDVPPWHAEFREPEARVSRFGRLKTTLTASFTELTLRFPPPDSNKVFFSRTYERMVPGPTLRVLPGDTVELLLKNHLVDPRPDPPSSANPEFQVTNFHTHGWHVDPKSRMEDGRMIASDDVLVSILPPGHPPPSEDHEHGRTVQTELQYEFRLPPYHAPGTHWYHAHNHGSVSKQAENGMAGALIIDEPPGQQILEGARERLIIIQDITNILVRESGTGEATLLDTANQADVVRSALDAAQEKKPGSIEKANLIYTTINGIYQPTGRMHPGETERWRIINAGANTRAFNDLFIRPAPDNPEERNMEFYKVASDGITLDEMLEPTRLAIGPGNRVDLIVQAPILDPANPDRYQQALRYEIGANEGGLYLGTIGYSNEKTGELPDRLPPPTFSSEPPPVGAPPTIDGTRQVYYKKDAKEGNTTYQYKVPKVQGETVLGHIEVAGVPEQPVELPFPLPAHSPDASYLDDIASEDVENTRTMVFDVTWWDTDENKNPVSMREGEITGGIKRLTVDGVEFGEVDGAEVTIEPGSVEEWTLINNSDQLHPFHIHVNPFQIVEVKQWAGYADDDLTKPEFVTPAWAPEPGTWLDTIPVPPRGYVKFRSRFADTVEAGGETYDFTGSFVMHCHILNHEDQGMMVIVNVE